MAFFPWLLLASVSLSSALLPIKAHINQYEPRNETLIADYIEEQIPYVHVDNTGIRWMKIRRIVFKDCKRKYDQKYLDVEVVRGNDVVNSVEVPFDNNFFLPINHACICLKGDLNSDGLLEPDLYFTHRNDSCFGSDQPLRVDMNTPVVCSPNVWRLYTECASATMIDFPITIATDNFPDNLQDNKTHQIRLATPEWQARVFPTAPSLQTIFPHQCESFEMDIEEYLRHRKLLRNESDTEYGLFATVMPIQSFTEAVQYDPEVSEKLIWMPPKTVNNTDFYFEGNQSKGVWAAQCAFSSKRDLDGPFHLPIVDAVSEWPVAAYGC